MYNYRVNKGEELWQSSKEEEAKPAKDYAVRTSSLRQLPSSLAHIAAQ